MCCFTGDVAVSKTQIFARDAGEGRQYLAYSMQVKNQQDVAMVLPLPVAAGSGDDALRFVDLSGFPHLFRVFHDTFDWIGLDLKEHHDEQEVPRGKPLIVHDVGAFEASFVPRAADFARLDERFRLAPGLWEKLPAYGDFGFAVFKLKPGDRVVHPLAFTFPRADPSALFFPTVHIHDGQIHDQADFDHHLYAQLDGHSIRERLWFESERLPRQVIDPKQLPTNVDGNQHVHLQTLSGKRPNQDTVLKFQ